MASRSIDLGGLPPIQQGGLDADSIQKWAGIMMTAHNLQLSDQEAKSKFGTPSVAPVVSTTKPFFAGTRGFQEVLGTPPVSSATDSLLQGGAAAGTGETPPTWVKPGTPGTIGTVEAARRLTIMPYTDPNSLDHNFSLLTGEPDPAKFNQGIILAPKGSKVDINLSPEAAKILNDMGADVKAGPMNADTYTQIHDALTIKSLSKTPEGSTAQLQKLQAELTNIKATLAEKTAKTEKTKAEIERVKAGTEALQTFLHPKGTAGADSTLLTDQAPPAPAPQKSIPTITNQADYDRLPSGATYKDAQGVVRKKK